MAHLPFQKRVAGESKLASSWEKASPHVQHRHSVAALIGDCRGAISISAISIAQSRLASRVRDELARCGGKQGNRLQDRGPDDPSGDNGVSFQNSREKRRVIDSGQPQPLGISGAGDAQWHFCLEIAMKQESRRLAEGRGQLSYELSVSINRL